MFSTIIIFYFYFFSSVFFSFSFCSFFFSWQLYLSGFFSFSFPFVLFPFPFYFSFTNCNCNYTFGASSAANSFLSCNPGSISEPCYVSSLCGCCRRDKLSSFCFNKFNGELSFSYSFKLYRLCNSSFKLDWQWEDWKINASRMCVFCTQCSISLEEMMHPCVQADMGRQGSMLTSPGAGSWSLPFPRASPVPPEEESPFWCLAKGPWPENPAPFPAWAVSWGFLGVAIWSGWFCSEEVSVQHWEVFPDSKGVWKPLHYIQ